MSSAQFKKMRTESYHEKARYLYHTKFIGTGISDAIFVPGASIENLIYTVRPSSGTVRVEVSTSSHTQITNNDNPIWISWPYGDVNQLAQDCSEPIVAFRFVYDGEVDVEVLGY